MSTISEKIELLGKGLYTDSKIPDKLTLKSIPTTIELEYVGAEDFDKTMLEKVFPQAIEEDIEFDKLFEIDFYWICRCLRILNYGPYFETNTIFCSQCGQSHRGTYQVDLRTIECKPLPSGFTNDIVIPRSEFLDFKEDVHMSLMTVKDKMNLEKDDMFKESDGRVNRVLGRVCYMIKSIGTRNNLDPISVRSIIGKEFSPADYVVLRTLAHEYTNYGMVAGGTVTCPKCGNTHASFIALVDDRFFRATLGSLRAWKRERDSNDSGKTKNV